jgi:hypothetical protein
VVLWCGLFGVMAWTCKPSGEICKSVEFWTGLFLSIFGKEHQGKELHGKEWYQRIKACWLGMEWNGLDWAHHLVFSSALLTCDLMLLSSSLYASLPLT